MGRVNHGGGGAGFGQFFHHNGIRDVVHTGTAVLLREGQPAEIRTCQKLEVFPGKAVLLVYFSSFRGKFGLGHFTHGLLDKNLFFREGKGHG